MALKLTAKSEWKGSPVLEVFWCLDLEDLALLDEYKVDISKVRVMILVSQKGHLENTSRYLAPLRDGRAYIEFFKSGEHTVHAAVIWPVTNSSDCMKRMNYTILHQKAPMRYANHYLLDFVPTEEGQEMRTEIVDYLANVSRHHSQIAPTSLEVVVDKAMFAKEWPSWITRYVNWGFQYKPQDPCHFRKRLLYAFSLKPFIMLLYAAMVNLFNLCFWFLAFVVYGYRNMNHRGLLHPFRDHQKDYLPEPRSSRYLENAQGVDNPWRMLLNPSLYLGIWVLSLFMRKYVTKEWFEVVIGLGGLFAFIVLAIYLNQNNNRFITWLNKLGEESDKKRVDKIIQVQNTLVCGAGSPEVRKNTPASIHLRFMDLKVKICKPYARE